MLHSQGYLKQRGEMCCSLNNSFINCLLFLKCEYLLLMSKLKDKFLAFRVRSIKVGLCGEAS